MNENIPSFLKLKDNALYYNGPGEFVFLVPEIYFERNHAIIEGEYVNLLGILNYAILKKESDTIMDNLKEFKFETVFLTKPNRIEKVRNLKLVKNKPGEDYRVLHYTDNGSDQIVVSISVPQDISNVEEFMQIFVKTGKIPLNIPYDKLHEYFLDNIALNGNSYKISAQMFGLVVSKICRDPNDISKPYRLSKAIESSMVDYVPISIKQISKITSPFTAITTQNWDEAVVSASIMDEKDIRDTPMEKIMTGDWGNI